MWQEIIVGSCVVIAVVFLLYHFLPAGKGKSGSRCGDCNGCSPGKQCR